MKYIFWNTKKKPLNSYIKELILENDYDFVALLEYNDDMNELILSLEQSKVHMKNIKTISEDIKLIAKTKIGKIISAAESDSYNIKVLTLPYDKKQIIATVHLQSKLYGDDEDRKIVISRLVREVERLEGKYNTKNTIIMGDFNANPFEDCIVSAMGLHAISSAVVAKKIFRTIKKTKYNMFYNPMWNKFGDFDGVAGTYYYGRGKTIELFWNIFDQVIIRPQIIELFSNDSLNIITSINGTKILESNKIRFSDHLPVEFIIKEA